MREKDGAARHDQLEKDGGLVYGEGDTTPGGSVCVRPSETHHQPRYGPVTYLFDARITRSQVLPVSWTNEIFAFLTRFDA